MSVDEPVGGPVVIRVTGDIDRTTVPVFGECVAEAIVCGRSLVVDLLDVGFVCPAGVSVLCAAATRMSANRCKTVIACSPGLQSSLQHAWKGAPIECFDTVAAAIEVVMRPRASSATRITVP
ncbi:MAG: STAS domain-containing protein [Rhodococcus sp. (in: high G+C Gram-positive bacteria)]